MNNLRFDDFKMGLWIPLDEQGLEDYEYCDYDSTHVKFVDIPDSERDILDSKGLITQFNREFGLIIGPWESEDIVSKNLERALEIVSPYADKLPSFIKYLNYAIEHHTLISITFE